MALSVCSLRDTCQKVAKKQFEDQWRQGRVEFIPVEWRTWLQLDKGGLKSFNLAPFLLSCDRHGGQPYSSQCPNHKEYC